MLKLATRRDESGSMVIAVTVMMVLALLSIGVLTRTVASQGQVRRNQDFNAGLAAADAGVADALYQLDQNASGSFGKTNVPLPDGDSFSYRVTQLTVPGTSPPAADPNRYVIHASGTVNGVRHNVLTTARRRQRFDYVMFARDSLKLAGSCSSSFGPVGSSGTIETSTNCTPVAHCFLTDSGLPAPKSNGCGDSGSGTVGATNNPNPNGRKINETNIKPSVDESLAAVPPSHTNLGCPWQATGTITGAISGHPSGYYLCNRAAGFTLSGNLTVSSPPAIIYLMSGQLTLANNANLNSVPLSNPAANLQIYVKAASNMNLQNTTNFVGGIYAPTSTFKFQPNGGTYNGSLVASTIEVNGAPNLGYLDQSLQTVTVESWKITGYREVPSTCPLTSTSC